MRWFLFCCFGLLVCDLNSFLVPFVVQSGSSGLGWASYGGVCAG